MGGKKKNAGQHRGEGDDEKKAWPGKRILGKGEKNTSLYPGERHLASKEEKVEFIPFVRGGRVA